MYLVKCAVVDTALIYGAESWWHYSGCGGERLDNNIPNSLMRCVDVNKPPSVSSEMTYDQKFVFDSLYSHVQVLTFYLISAVLEVVVTNYSWSWLFCPSWKRDPSHVRAEDRAPCSAQWDKLWVFVECVHTHNIWLIDWNDLFVNAHFIFIVSWIFLQTTAAQS